MWTRLKATINHLRAQSKKRTIDRRRLRDQLKYKENKISALEAENASLRKLLEPQKVFNHVYPVQMVALAVFIVVHAGGSLRCAAATIAFYAKMMGWKYTRPSPSTIRNWVLRCGYQALKYTKDLKGDYVLIIDESIQIGAEKLLLMLGIKVQTDRCFCTPLTGKDVQVLGMEVQSSWTSDLVVDFVKRNLNDRPLINILYVVSDRGTSLLAAFRKLDLRWVSDCSHEMMNAVKDLFKHNKVLSQLSASIGQLRQQLMLTKWSQLLPPTLRDKDRFLRIFTIVEWADRMDSYWNKLPPQGRQHIAFYRKAWPLIRSLRQVRNLIVITAGILKSCGMSEFTYRQWQDKISQYVGSQKVLTHQAKSFIAKMKIYFEDHARLYQQFGQLLCCSDIIESTFSRYKNKGGMKAISADVLSIALYNQELTTHFIQAAMTTVSCKDVEQWQKLNVCQNRYGLRKRMDRELKSTG